MNLYRKYLLPKFLNASMKKEAWDQHRSVVVKEAVGEVLEIGFGSGLNLPHYKNIKKLYALEPSKEFFAFAKERIDKVPFSVEHVQASAEKMPFGDNTFDTVVSTWTLCSIPDVEAALKEVFRVLKNDGKFIFIDLGKSPRKFLSLVQNILSPISELTSGGCHINREIDMLIEKSGLKFEHIERFQQKSRPLIFMYKGVAIKR